MRLWLTILWGLFCACSWTWCIGMFLPKIMIERWGWWGFLAFAVPNVIGCTAFGYFVKNRARSEVMIARHARAMTVFSSVTIAYHMFFIVWLFDSIIAMPNLDFRAPLAIAGIVFALAGVFSFLPNRDWLGLSIVVYAASLLAFLELGPAEFQFVEWTGRMSPLSLSLISPLLVFGFFLCPYLDLTFHRAIQHAPSRHAFLAFGITFAIMIVLTIAIWQSPLLLQQGWLPAIVIAHLLGQTVFTVGAHVRELRVSTAVRSRTSRTLAVFLPLLAVPMVYVAQTLSDADAIGENLYIAFLSLYGSLFPAWFAYRALIRNKDKPPAMPRAD